MPAFTTDPDELGREIRALPMTFEPLPDVEMDALSSSDRELVERFFYEAGEGKRRSIRALKRLSGKYPRVVALKNHLSVAYNAAGKHALADKLTEEIHENHPDYLFGRLNVVARVVEKPDKEDRVLELLGETLRLRDLQPEVKLFHFSHVRGFYNVVALFHLHHGRPRVASAIHRVLADLIGEDEPALVQLQMTIASHNLEEMKRRMDEDEARAIRVSVNPLPIAEDPPDFFPPGFRHPEIEAFYRHEFDFPKSEIDAILALPRETLIADLEAVLRDSLSRGELYREERIDYEDEETCFPLHALFFLGELKAVDSLPLVLEVLSQPDEALDYWFGELLHTQLWRVLFRLAGDRLESTADWMLAPGIPANSRETLAMAAVQIALHQPERREEILAWFQQILEFLLESPPEDNILDTELVNGMVWQLMDLRAVELLPLISRHFEKGFVAVSQVGDLDEIESTLNEPLGLREKRPLHRLDELYRELKRIFDPEPAAEDPNDFDATEVLLGPPGSNPFNGGEPFGLTGPPVPGPRIKVGRNQPCPCGSGKKYKKCCG